MQRKWIKSSSVFDGKFAARGTVEELRKATGHTNRHALSPRAGEKLRAAFVCLVVCFFAATTHQFTARGNQLLPQQTDQEAAREEVNEVSIKASETTAAPRRKALRQRLLRLEPAINRGLLSRVGERRPAIALRWSAHTDRHRGPPSSTPFS